MSISIYTYKFNRMRNTLIVFARKPQRGKVKTRLANTIGIEKAFSTYKQLLNNTLEIAKKAQAQLKVYWSESTNYTDGVIQKGNDLGERMYNAFVSELNGESKVCLLGSDVPYITVEIIDKSFEHLGTNDIVFGPSKDGGYYLVALKTNPPSELFLNKKWSHDKVLEDALEVCKRNNLKVHLMQTLLDIDTKEDYEEWTRS